MFEGCDRIVCVEVVNVNSNNSPSSFYYFHSPFYFSPLIHFVLNYKPIATHSSIPLLSYFPYPLSTKLPSTPPYLPLQLSTLYPPTPNPSTHPSSLRMHPSNHVFLRDVMMSRHDTFHQSAVVVTATLGGNGSGNRKHGDNSTPRDVVVFENEISE